MTANSAPGRRTAALRPAGIGLLAAGVAVALYVAGRVHTVNPAFSLFGRQYAAAIALKALATVVLGLADLQVLLALWMYRKLPLAGSSLRPVRLTHRAAGFVLFALTLPIAAHCLIALTTAADNVLPTPDGHLVQPPPGTCSPGGSGTAGP